MYVGNAFGSSLGAGVSAPLLPLPRFLGVGLSSFGCSSFACSASFLIASSTSLIAVLTSSNCLSAVSFVTSWSSTTFLVSVTNVL